MTVNIYSSTYAPLVGGQETIARILATQLQERGHAVSVLCENPGPEKLDNIPIERANSWIQRERRQSSAEANIVFGATFKGLSGFRFQRQPLIWHQSWLPANERKIVSIARRQLLTRGRNLAASRAIAAQLPISAEIVPNAYDDSVFKLFAAAKPLVDLLFVGRLVSDKGITLLIRAMGRLKSQGFTPKLTIVGGGPDEGVLRAEVDRLRLKEQVSFLGVQAGVELASTYNNHKILIVPSIWKEPFGIVALEGLACGCCLLVSDSGGLPEAAGAHGLTFKSGDESDLSQKISLLLTSPETVAHLRKGAEHHLARHTRAALANRFEAMLRSNSTQQTSQDSRCKD